MGLILQFGPSSTPLHIANNGLSAFVDVDVFDRNFLLALAAMPIESFQKRGVGPRKLVCLAEVFASPFKRLLTDHGAPVAFHRGVVAGN